MTMAWTNLGNILMANGAVTICTICPCDVITGTGTDCSDRDPVIGLNITVVRDNEFCSGTGTESEVTLTIEIVLAPLGPSPDAEDPLEYEIEISNNADCTGTYQEFGNTKSRTPIIPLTNPQIYPLVYSLQAGDFVDDSCFVIRVRARTASGWKCWYELPGTVECLEAGTALDQI